MKLIYLITAIIILNLITITTAMAFTYHIQLGNTGMGCSTNKPIWFLIWDEIKGGNPCLWP